MDWKLIQTQDDIDSLKEEYSNFHDSCIISVNYMSGAYINEDNAMGLNKDENNLVVTFQSQINGVDKKTIQLCFTRVLNLHLSGVHDNYFCDIIDCYLGFHDSYIIWSDNGGFEPAKHQDNSLLQDSIDTIVIAKSLKWRFI